MNTPRVLIVADDPLARAGLAALLADQDGCTVVGQVAATDSLLASRDVYQPDVILWDPGWEPDFSSDRLADFAEGGVPVVALLSAPDQAAAAWTAGARGLLQRDTSTAALLAAIAAAAQGLAVIDPALAPALPLAYPGSPTETLTPRELEVLRLLAEGLPNKAIALRLDISEHTVKFHLNAILGKLGAQSRTEAVVQAIRLGLVAV
jgi:two-component system nitrate/nitrite response regulator NarL